MTETERILQAQRDPRVREELLVENNVFIRRCASKAAGRFVDRNDDAYSEALLAFNDAVAAYRVEKGAFRALAAVAIQNRVVDLLRKEGRNRQTIPFSALSTQDDDGCEKPFEMADPRETTKSDAALEIEDLRMELEIFGVSFFDLPKASPKFKRTKRACKEVVAWLVRRPELVREAREKKVLPVKRITEELGVGVKLLERNRAYVVAGMLICAGDYPIMQNYFELGKEER